MNHTRRNRLLTIFYEARESIDDLHHDIKSDVVVHQIGATKNWNWHLTKIEECRQNLLKATRMLQKEQQR